MGACCCCASTGVELNASPGNYHYPAASEEREPLSSSHHGTPSSALSPGLIVDTNLATSTPDTYRPPPTPLPYDFNLRRPLTPSRTQETNADEITNVKEGDCKVKSDDELASSEAVEFEDTDDLKKSSKPFVPEEEDGCPICLEEYDDENPKLLTKCEHHFHLACILEWMERSDACPVCNKEVIIDPSLAS